MTECNHKNCGSTEKIWLPYYHEGRMRGLKPHPYCIDCGLIKSLSSDRPRSVGYYMNVLSDLNKLYKITQIQVRLVVREFEKQGLDDTYGLNRLQQERLFIDIVKKYINVPERRLQELL
jgi:hypothetical protein